MSVELLSPLRHSCTGCGGSCQGSHAYLLDEEEVRRVAQYGAELEIPNPIEDGHLRQQAGSCVFLGSGSRCRIHAAYGADLKPTVCRQYPVVALRTESGLRVGIDPGCYTHLETYPAAPELEDARFVAKRLDIPSAQVSWEQAFLDRTEGDDVRVADVLSLLTGKKGNKRALPSGFARRLVRRLKQADLGVLLELPDTPIVMRIALRPVAESIEGWNPNSPPRWGLARREDRFAVDAIRRMVHLRLASGSIPTVAGAALLMTCGVVVSAWTNPDPEPFGRAMAAWSRGIRVPAFWRSIVPDSAAIQELATG